MKEEIAAGIKNALERGSSVEEAIQSFVNAGYNYNEVRQAADMIMHGATSIISPLSSVPANNNPPVNGNVQTPPETKKRGKWKAILLISILVILIIGVVASVFFKEKILELINSFYG